VLGNGRPDVLFAKIFIVIGIVFAIALVGIVFILVGMSILNKARARGRRRLEILERGDIVCGQITNVIHVQHPKDPDEIGKPQGESLDWRVEYRFPVAGRDVYAAEDVVSWGPTPWVAGTLVWIAVLREDPSRSALWPID
jgi:hypothetical protein